MCNVSCIEWDVQTKSFLTLLSYLRFSLHPVSICLKLSLEVTAIAQAPAPKIILVRSTINMLAGFGRHKSDNAL